MIKYLLLVFLIYCSFDGGKVKEVKTFEKEKKDIINLKLVQCGLNEINEENDLESKLLILALFPESSFYELGLFKSHVTNKDAQFCYESLYVTPCGLNALMTGFNLLSTEMLYCNPKSACMGDKQNFGQGELCISGE